MKIDWKHVANSPGYLSLKEAYIKDIQKANLYLVYYKTEPMRNKTFFLNRFRWVIGRAQHYANHTGRPVEFFLSAWESQRNNTWWINFYQEACFPKFFEYSKYNVKSKSALGTKEKPRWSKYRKDLQKSVS